MTKQAGKMFGAAAAGALDAAAIVAEALGAQKRHSVPPAEVELHNADGGQSAFVTTTGAGGSQRVSWQKLMMTCTCGATHPRMCDHVRIVIREGYDRLAAFGDAYSAVGVNVQVPLEPAMEDPCWTKVWLEGVKGHPELRNAKVQRNAVPLLELGFVDEFTPRRDLVARLRTVLTAKAEEPCPSCGADVLARVQEAKEAAGNGWSVPKVLLGRFIVEHDKCPLCGADDLVPEFP